MSKLIGVEPEVIQKLEFNHEEMVLPSSLNECGTKLCEPGKLCKNGEWFEQIEQCLLCGKLV
jgi:hypothetical protein